MTFTLRPEVSTARTENGTVLLDETTGRYWQLNDTAAFILSALMDGATTQEAAHRLHERHPVLPAEQAADDVASVIRALSTARLVAAIA
ncbi:lasso peptide biosynthesis PqqD family chaperone [Streptomyces luteoverticillatus]|uniref:Lasso peptide biosynthesis PqqD family chaperone n=1 Tax=Streptomyces luteoverticillatus TaxID=66425 RepID=A0A3Q9FVL6_STRLT|nr:lasso peptide biosynthesis PqqD family chaperone [Streptomyces luteoverticillatus]AZQ70206.1 lasso peptide biosynthesis PqqD family chaperone [Streptomyces luteoverticillatus]